jgi:hypothetical protein
MDATRMTEKARSSEEGAFISDLSESPKSFIAIVEQLFS